MTVSSRTGSRVRRRDPATLVVGAMIILVLGVVAGGVWAVATPAMTAVKGYTRVIATDSIAGVSCFAFVMLGYGVIAAIVAWTVCSGWRGLAGYGALLAATVLGSGGAGLVGTALAARRFPDPDSIAVGHYFTGVPDLWLDGVTRGSPSGPWALVICAPLAATLGYLLFALANRHGDLGVGDGPPEPTEPTAPTAGPGEPEMSVPPRSASRLI